MIGYFVSLFMGLAVGAAYGLVQVRSPAPPMIALVGLFGMVLGQQAIDTAKRHFMLQAQTYIRHDVSGVTAHGGQGNQNELELRE
jgi:XapX domain-containing protein